MATSCTYALAIVMNYVGGRLSETFDAPRIYLAFHVLSLPALFATASLSGIPLVLLAAIYAGCALGTQPAENSLVAQLSPARSRSTAFGVKFTLAFGVGALAVPLVSHQLQTADLHTVMLTLAGFTTALVITVSLLSTWLLRAPIRVKP
jgi:predicted MFS family arabinose efflux permease